MQVIEDTPPWEAAGENEEIPIQVQEISESVTEVDEDVYKEVVVQGFFIPDSERFIKMDELEDPGQQDYRTPEIWLEYARKQLVRPNKGFTLDAAASEYNAVVERFFDEELDAFAQEYWDEVVWCNPPFGKIEPWLELAQRTAKEQRAEWMLLLPNSTDAGWYHRFVWNKQWRTTYPRTVVDFVEGRINFNNAFKGKVLTNNDRGSMFVHIFPLI